MKFSNQAFSRFSATSLPSPHSVLRLSSSPRVTSTTSSNKTTRGARRTDEPRLDHVDICSDDHEYPQASSEEVTASSLKVATAAAVLCASSHEDAPTPPCVTTFSSKTIDTKPCRRSVMTLPTGMTRAIILATVLFAMFGSFASAQINDVTGGVRSDDVSDVDVNAMRSARGLLRGFDDGKNGSAGVSVDIHFDYY